MKFQFSIVWLLSYISIASVSAAMVTPALPYIQSQFFLNSGEVEWVVSAFLIGYVLGQLIYGPLANAHGRLKALRLGLKINIFGLIVCLMSSVFASYSLLVLGRFITGLGAAAGLACTFMLINEWLPEESRKTAMAYSTLSFAIGIGLAVMVGGVVSEYWHWQGCFLLLMLQGIFMLWGTRVFRETLIQPKPIQVRTLFHDYIKALSSLKLVVFSMVVGMCSSVAYCFSAAGPQIAHDYLHLSVANYGYWNGLNIVGMLLGGLFSRELLERFSTYTVIGIGFLGSVIGLFSLVGMWQAGSHSVGWFFITVTILYVFDSCFFAAGAHKASNALLDKASASSMMSFINMSFATLNVVVMGYLSPDPLVAFISILTCLFLLMLAVLVCSFRSLRA